MCSGVWEGCGCRVRGRCILGRRGWRALLIEHTFEVRGVIGVDLGYCWYTFTLLFSRHRSFVGRNSCGCATIHASSTLLCSWPTSPVVDALNAHQATPAHSVSMIITTQDSSTVSAIQCITLGHIPPAPAGSSACCRRGTGLGVTDPRAMVLPAYSTHIVPG